MPFSPADFYHLYARFDAPVAVVDCGERCAPHNQHAIPFCCDARHAVPSAYETEWEYLQYHTDLWHPWQGRSEKETTRLREQAALGQLLIECLGPARCQRDYRSITCRSFPFFPYITREGVFTGLAYYWEYADRCWVINHLEVVTQEFRAQFVAFYDELFDRLPDEKENFHSYSTSMRRVFGRKHRAIPLLHRQGGAYKITPRNGRLRRVPTGSLPKFGAYRLAKEIPFPDET